MSVQKQIRCAIVAEGGGQRGIFTAGVLDTFQDAGFNPFDLGVGVSAGAQNLLSYFLQVPGYARRAISELTVAPRFFVPYRWLGPRSVIDLDSYFDHICNNPAFRLPIEALDGMQNGHRGPWRRLEFVATRQDSLEPLYLQPTTDSVYVDMRATSAVPLLYRTQVLVDGLPAIDGGVADPLPLARALASGATHVVVIRTVPSRADRPGWRQRFDALGLARALPESVRGMLATHDRAYGAALALLQQPPPGTTLIEIAPEVELHSSAFGSDPDQLHRDYERGRNAAVDLMPTLQNELGNVFRYHETNRSADNRPPGGEPCSVQR